MRIWTSALLLAVAATAQAQTPEQGNNSAAETEQPNRMRDVGRSAGKIATQPGRDVGAIRTDIPPVLQEAVEAPYGMKGIKSCRDISAAFHDLTDVIGPDFKSGEVKKENRAGKLAEAGGKTIVNSLIPFRGLVREVTGAAPAQRRLERAIAAGYARRGFLRGMHQARKCKTKLF